MALNEKSFNSSPDKSLLPDYTKIVHSSKFQELLKQKRNFILPLTLFFLAFYFTLPVMTAYSTVLNKAAFGPVSWAWVFASAQFIMTWVLCVLYTRRAKEFDVIVEEIKHEHLKSRGSKE